MNVMNDVRKIVRGIIIVVVIIIFLIILLTTGNILMFASIFKWVQTQVHVITGLDATLCKAIGALIVALLVALPLGAIALSFTPIPQNNKGLYRALLFLLIAGFFAFAYFGGKDVYFNSQDGKPMKYYSERPNGEIKFYPEPGNDPITGDVLKPVTKEIVLKAKGLLPKVDTIPKPIVMSETSNSDHNSYQAPASYQPSYQSGAKPQERIIDTPRITNNSVTVSSSGYESARKQFVCHTTFQNISSKYFVIKNYEQEQILVIPPRNVATLNLRPGKYFFKVTEKNEWHPFSVPNKASFVINLEAKSTPVVKSYRRNNSNSRN